MMFLHSYNFLCANSFFGPRPPQLVSKWLEVLLLLVSVSCLAFTSDVQGGGGGGILLEDKTSEPDVVS